MDNEKTLSKDAKKRLDIIHKIDLLREVERPRQQNLTNVCDAVASGVGARDLSGPRHLSGPVGFLLKRIPSRRFPCGLLSFPKQNEPSAAEPEPSEALLP